MADGIRDDIPDYRKRLIESCKVNVADNTSTQADLDMAIGILRVAVPIYLTPQTISNVIRAMEEKALTGDVAAAELLLKLAKDA